MLVFERQKTSAKDLATEEEKYQKESESLGAKEIVKTVAEKSIDSIALFNKIYERNIGSKVSINVSLMFYVNYINHIHI